MQIIRDGILLCNDCTIAAVNGDFTGLDYYYGQDAERRRAEVERGLERLGPHLVPAFDSETGEGIDEFSTQPCGCCETRLHGERHEFSILGPEAK